MNQVSSEGSAPTECHTLQSLLQGPETASELLSLVLAAMQPLQESPISDGHENCIALLTITLLHTCVVEVCNAFHTRSVLPQALDASVFCITHGFHDLKLTPNTDDSSLTQGPARNTNMCTV